MRTPRSNHYGQPGSTIVGKERLRIIAWIDEGLTRNEVARRAHRSPSTVSGIAKAEGLEFANRARVKAATDARRIDLRAMRAEASEKLLRKALELIEETDKPFLAFNIGGKDNVYTEHELDHAPTGDKKNLIQAAATAIGRHLDLESHDADQRAESARGMLAELGRALGVQPPADA